MHLIKSSGLTGFYWANRSSILWIGKISHTSVHT